MARKPTEYVQFKLRIREGLRRKLEREAEQKKHSTNAEAVERLEESFAAAERSKEAGERSKAALEAVKDATNNLLQKAKDAFHQQQLKEVEIQAAFRDSDLLRSLSGGDLNVAFLRYMVFLLDGHPNWSATSDSRKEFAKKVEETILNYSYRPAEQSKDAPK